LAPFRSRAVRLLVPRTSSPDQLSKPSRTVSL
jgi:hypothetical protein